jgi:hypothetical protein
MHGLGLTTILDGLQFRSNQVWNTTSNIEHYGGDPHYAKQRFTFKACCEDFLHTSTTKICIHKKNRLEVELLCS